MYICIYLFDTNMSFLPIKKTPQLLDFQRKGYKLMSQISLIDGDSRRGLPFYFRKINDNSISVNSFNLIAYNRSVKNAEDYSELANYQNTTIPVPSDEVQINRNNPYGFDTLYFTSEKYFSDAV